MRAESPPLNMKEVIKYKLGLLNDNLNNEISVNDGIFMNF